MRASEKIQIVSGNPIATLKRCSGYYAQVPRSNGSYGGPLVGYAGKDELGRQLVGRVFYNFAKMERFWHVSDYFTSMLHVLVHAEALTPPDVVMPAPMGGLAMGRDLCRHGDWEYCYPEKRVVAVATKDHREESVLVFDRHELDSGMNVVIFEDVCNNFSTTALQLKLIELAGCRCVAIACMLNRSKLTMFKEIPVVSLSHIPTEQFRQDDSEVLEDIKKGNVVWKPKHEWARLEAAMQAA